LISKKHLRNGTNQGPCNKKKKIHQRKKICTKRKKDKLIALRTALGGASDRIKPTQTVTTIRVVRNFAHNRGHFEERPLLKSLVELGRTLKWLERNRPSRLEDLPPTKQKTQGKGGEKRPTYNICNTLWVGLWLGSTRRDQGITGIRGRKETSHEGEDENVCR